VQYTLVGPPLGLVQPAQGQEYRRILTDPHTLLVDDAKMAQPIDLYRPDGIAPIGISGDHTLRTGQAMVSYRYLQNVFEDNFVHARRISNARVQSAFPFVPNRRLNGRQVALLEYGATDNFTFLAQLPFWHNEIDYLQPGGGNFHTSFTNPGDISLTGLYVLRREARRQWHLNMGLSIPTGFLDYLTNQPSATVPNLPYQLRTSSGSYELLPGVTYRGQSDAWSWGFQSTARIPLGLNRFNYEAGNEADITGWFSRRWTERWSTSARLDGLFIGDIRRADPRLDPRLAPTNRPSLQGSELLNALFGINYYLPDGRVPGQRLSIEAGLPIFQSLSGPQLGLDWAINSGWTMIF